MMTIPAEAAQLTRIDLARDARTTLVLPAVLVLLGVAVSAGSAVLLGWPAMLIGVGIGLALFGAGAWIALRTRSLQLAVETDYLHLTGLRVDRQYHLARGGLSRVAHSRTDRCPAAHPSLDPGPGDGAVNPRRRRADRGDPARRHAIGHRRPDREGSSGGGRRVRGCPGPGPDVRRKDPCRTSIGPGCRSSPRCCPCGSCCRPRPLQLRRSPRPCPRAWPPCRPASPWLLRRW